MGMNVFGIIFVLFICWENEVIYSKKDLKIWFDNQFFVYVVYLKIYVKLNCKFRKLFFIMYVKEVRVMCCVFGIVVFN